MSDICAVCGLPKDLCVCEEIAREEQQIRIFTEKRRFGKLMTVVEGIDSSNIDIKDLCTTLKTCLLYTSPSPRDRTRSRMPSSA